MISSRALLLLLFLGLGAAQGARLTHHPGAPGFLGSASFTVRSQRAAALLEDAPEVAENSPSKPSQMNATVSFLKKRRFGATAQESWRMEEVCVLEMKKAAKKKVACPHTYSAPPDLESWKDQATCCLAHCGGMSDNCFDGCMDDCVQYDLDCTGLAMQNECYAKCQGLGDCNACLDTVQADDTSSCNLKCMQTFDADVQGSNCAASFR